jgi:hypothetical protein
MIEQSNSDRTARACVELMDFVNGLFAHQGRIRAEDSISALAAIAGERCIDAAGNYNPFDHEHAPGMTVFSDKVNELLTGDVGSTDWGAITAAVRSEPCETS